MQNSSPGACCVLSFGGSARYCPGADGGPARCCPGADGGGLQGAVLSGPACAESYTHPAADVCLPMPIFWAVICCCSIPPEVVLCPPHSQLLNPSDLLSSLMVLLFTRPCCVP